MIWKGKETFKTEGGEPVLRSCWKCNPAHEHLKKVNFLHVCFNCGRYWIFGKFLDEFASLSKCERFFSKMGMKPGDSTSKIDAGYRISKITFKKVKK